MFNLSQLRLAAREIFNEALRAVDAGAALRRSIQFNGTLLTIGEISTAINCPVYAIAIGKAAHSMAGALQSVLGDFLTAGVISSTPAAQRTDNRWQVFAGGHPLPNDESLRAAEAAISLLEQANQERGLIIFLVSGGGSAMLELPVNQTISLEDMRAANQALVRSGASIREINSVRRAFSAVKGGKLAAAAPDCDQITLIVSDVPHGEERNVASGPTLSPPAEAPAAEVIARYHLRDQLPRTIVRAIETGQKPEGNRGSAVGANVVLLDNRTALDAAAEAARGRGFVTEIAEDISDQPIQQGCELLLQRLEALRLKSGRSPACLISGGEFACPVLGNGMGGRNLETALRIANSRPAADFVAICAGTDGIDGNSPAAGAIIDNTTNARADSIGLDANDFLQRSDAYSYFVALGDVINTGATGTNVRDLRILLAW